MRTMTADGDRYSPQPSVAISTAGMPSEDVDPTRAPASEPGLRVVIVEDDPDYAWLVQEMLRDAFAGGQLELIAFGTLAEMRAEPLVADCALVDLSLPDAGGLEILEAVREALPGSPIVVLTGAEDET